MADAAVMEIIMTANTSARSDVEKVSYYSTQRYWSNKMALLGASNYVQCNLKEHESQEREGKGEDHVKSSSRLEVFNVGTLTFSIGNLLHKIGSITEKAAFLRSKNRGCGGAT